MVHQSRVALEQVRPALRTISLGATAIGTGIAADPRYAEAARRHLSEITGLELETAADLVATTSNMGAFMELSGAINRFAMLLSKICSDLRLLSSGPQAGIGDIRLPERQAGSSIMPGKVNPVICEASIMVCAQVIGNDTAIAWSGTNGAFELNVGIPVMAANLLESVRLLANTSRVMADKMIDGITANVERARFLAEASPSIVTPLNKFIGYENAAKIAKKAVAEGLTIRETVVAMGFLERSELTEEQLDTALDVMSMTRPPHKA
jgi:fumarate hydratase class II